MPWRFEANAVLLSAALLALTLLPGCLTREQRWEEFDTERRQEIGVKTKELLSQRVGKAGEACEIDDGGEDWTWEFSGYGGA